MPLLLSGRGFRRELESAGCMAVHAPLEGGAETRLLRRLRAAGYRTHLTSARGLGDPEVFLFQKHGVRPPHLGHQSVGRGAAVGEVHDVMLPCSAKSFLAISLLCFGCWKARFCLAPSCSACVTFAEGSLVSRSLWKWAEPEVCAGSR